MTLKLGRVPGAADSGTGFRRGTLKAQTPRMNWHCPGCGGTNKGAWTRCLTKGCNMERP